MDRIMTEERSISPPPPSPRARYMQWHLAVLVGFLAVATRIWGLGQPDVFVFDEVFYAGDALDLIAHGVEGGTAVHPPIGKWMIATGIRLLGFDPVGWRSAALVAGAVVAGLTWYLARRLGSSPIVAVAAASMVLFDGITVVTGRIALLDGFVALWVLAAVGCTLAMIAMPMDQSAQRRLRVATGILLGLAIATKWSAAPVALVVLVTTLFLDDHLPRSQRRRAYALSVVLLVILPALVYVLAHAGWLAQYEETTAYARACAEERCTTGPLDRTLGFVDYQRDLLDFHRSLSPSHSDVRSSTTWVAQTGVVELYGERPANSAWTHVLVFGNPVLWVAGFAGIPPAFVLAWRRRDIAAGFLASVSLALWLPWIVGGRPGFAFYGAPLLPILALALARNLTAIPPRARHIIASTIVVAALVGAAVWWPLWTGRPVDPGYADHVLVFDDLE